MMLEDPIWRQFLNVLVMLILVSFIWIIIKRITLLPLNKIKNFLKIVCGILIAGLLMRASVIYLWDNLYRPHSIVTQIVSRVGLYLFAPMSVMISVLTLTVLGWGILGWFLHRHITAKVKTEIGNENDSRRNLLRSISILPPAVVAGSSWMSGVYGVKQAQIREHQWVNPDLPKSLDGFTIAQITDLHLGPFIDVDHLQKAVKWMIQNPPDIIVLTGDIADDMEKLPRFLEMLKAVPARFGIVAIIGNHELYRGKEKAITLYKKYNVTYLENQIHTIAKNDCEIHFHGVDDPGFMGRDTDIFYHDALDTIKRESHRINSQNPQILKILLSHRPDIFPLAVREQYALTLSGHTHGGQMALWGKSVFAMLFNRPFFLGWYHSQKSWLYTSPGSGHWLPLRINCPTEISIIRCSHSR